VISTSLVVASDTETEVDFTSWLRYPDGSVGETNHLSLPLAASLDNHVVVTAVITSSQMGLHQLLYTMSPAGTGKLLRQFQDGGNGGPADGMEGFDIGPATLDRVTTNQVSYVDPGDPVYALLDIYSQLGGPAQVSVLLDVGPETNTGIVLDPGYQTISVTLSSPIPPGSRVLTATLLMDGFWSARSTSFDFGADLPDLVPGAPALSSGEINVMVANAGQGESSAAALEILLDGSALIGTYGVPELLPGETVVITAPWNTMGQGGDRVLSAIVDPAGFVVEYDESNNTSERAITIHRLELETALDDEIYIPGEVVSITAQLLNNTGSSFGVVLTSTIIGPDGLVVFTDDRPLTLSPGPSDETVSWPSTGHQTGLYALHQEARDGYDEVVLEYISFELSLAGPQANFTSNSPVALGSMSIFTNTTAGGGTLSFEWYFGDATPVVTGTHPSHLYAEVGLYTVILTATNEGGSSVFSSLHEVLPLAPQASFTSNTPVVVGNLSVFTNTTTGGGTIDFEWNFGDGSPTAADIHPTHTYPSEGDYTVVLTATNASGYSVVSHQHLVVPVSPQAGFTSNSPVTLGSLSVFTNTSTGGGTLSYQWNFGDGSPVSSDAHPTHLYNETGSFAVVLTATNEGGTDVFSGLHEVIEDADNDVYLPLLMNSYSPVITHESGRETVQSCQPEQDGFAAFVFGVAGAFGLAQSEKASCAPASGGLPGWSWPWLLLIGTTFLFRRRKRR
jgi:PKD repeat protein